jgi:hypothetical protein
MMLLTDSLKPPHNSQNCLRCIHQATTRRLKEFTPRLEANVLVVQLVLLQHHALAWKPQYFFCVYRNP